MTRNAVLNQQLGLRQLLAPRSVVIVGASAESANTRNLIRGMESVGFAGKLTAVNPNRGTVLGVPCVPSLAALDEPPDMAVVLLPAHVVPATLADLAQIGCHAAHVLAAGASEADRKALRDFIQEHKITLLGPNCNGFVNVIHRVHGWSGPLRRPYKSGALAIVGQSGAVLGSSVHSAWDRGLGLSYVVSTGDELGVSTVDVLHYLANDADTRVVICYLESLADFDRLAVAVTACHAAGTPVITIGPMASDAARRVSLSHTGAVTPPAAITAAALDALGVIRAGTVDEALDRASLYAQLPRATWRDVRRVGVLSVSGGWSAILSELLTREGLELPPLPQAIVDMLPPQLSPTNPVDMTGIRQFASLYPRLVDAFVEHNGFDAVVVQTGAWEGSEPWFAPVWAWAYKASKPVFLGGNEILALGEDTRRAFERNPLPVVQGAERIARALGAMRHLDRGNRVGVADKASNWSGPSTATLLDLQDRLMEYGLSVARMVSTEQTTRSFPVAMKLESAELPHKTEVGAVRLPLRNEGDKARAQAELADLAAKLGLKNFKIVEQPCVEGALELLVGSVVHADVGAVLTVGLGGIWTEILGEKAHALCPLDSTAADELIARLNLKRILDGYRGKPALAHEKLRDTLVAASRFAHDHRTRLRELDLNPVLLTTEDCVVVDALASFDP